MCAQKQGINIPPYFVNQKYLPPFLSGVQATMTREEEKELQEHCMDFAYRLFQTVVTIFDLGALLFIGR